VPRIIAGFAGSVPLKAPPRGTRPTADRVREALFSALEARGALEGARVLDLYAGSGALGLEAVSRGAASAVLVDQNAAAAGVLRVNAAAVRRADPAGAGVPVQVVAVSVRSYLEGLGDGRGDGPTLVLSDPPYDLPAAAVEQDLAGIARVAAPGAVVVLERATRTPEPAWPPGLLLERARRYGDTTLYVATLEAPGLP
jgi:16S rRNA (guanine966-N2)-methyltransferase